MKYMVQVDGAENEEGKVRGRNRVCWCAVLLEEDAGIGMVVGLGRAQSPPLLPAPLPFSTSCSTTVTTWIRSSASGPLPQTSPTTAAQRPGEICVPMHWTDTMAGGARANRLPCQNADPISGQPEFKHTPVRVEAFRVSWHGFALGRRPLPLDGVTHLEICIVPDTQGGDACATLEALRLL